MSSMQQQSSALEIIALDFYDGPTEGFVLELSDHGPCYFRIVACDKDWDQRLFAATKIDLAVIDELSIHLGIKEKALNSAVCVPRWVFKSIQQEKRADDIVVACQNKMEQSGFLILGGGIANENSKEVAYGRELRQKLSRSFSGGEVDSLKNWLQHF